MRRGIAVAAGAVIAKIVRPTSSLQPIAMEPPLREFRRRAVGCCIQHVGRLGKRILLELDSGDRIVIEPRMTGLVLLADPPNRKHLRLVIELSGPAEQILFWDQRGLGLVRLVSPQEFDAKCGPAKIGPDAMEITVDEFRERLGRSRGRSRSRCSIKRHWPAWEISTPRRSSIVPAFIRPDLAAACGKTSGSGSTPKCSACCRKRSSTKARPSATAPIACPRRAGQLPVQSPRLSAARADLPRLREGPDRADRAGPAIDVLLSGLSTKITPPHGCN